MDILYLNVLNEIEKIFLKKRNVILLIITALCTMLVSFGITSFQSKLGVAAITGSAFPEVILGFFIKIFLPLFIFMAGADMFTGEGSDRTLKLVLTKPLSRLKIFISKNIALSVYAAINLLVIFIISFTASLFFSVKGDILSGFLSSFGVYFAALIPVTVIVLLTAFVSQLFKSSSSTLTTCILIYIGFYILGLFFPIVDSISIVKLLDWHALWTQSNIIVMQIINKLVQIIAYSIIFFGLGSYIFDKKEI